jgi:sugar O-acyltransferase (sialic acid O-acetyltransferase NeuD family)
MPQFDVLVPRINNNDDTVRLVEWHATVGARVAAGATLATLETAKAAVEVPSDVAGFVRWLSAPASSELHVGSVLAVLTHEPGAAFTPPSAVLPSGAQHAAGQPTPRASTAPRLTLKARAVARSLGLSAVELECALPAGVIGEDAVRAFAARRDAARDTAAPRTLDLADGRAAIIVGDGAHARYVHDTALRASACRVVGCISNERARGDFVGRMSVLGRDADLAALFKDGVRKALVGVGSSRSGARSNAARQRIYEKLVELGFEVPTIVDPDASLSASATLGAGTLVGARAVVSAHATTGVNCLVNVGAIVCHDVKLGDHVHVTPGAILAGSVTVGDGSTIGMAATVLDGTRIGRDCLVPNNVRVIRDLEDGQTAPAL